jgi:hypothetical protein
MHPTYVSFQNAKLQGGLPRENPEALATRGADCAQWLFRQLQASGIQSVTAPRQASWGWELSWRDGRGTTRLEIGVAAEDPPEWRIGIESMRTLLGGLFQLVDRKAESRTAQLVHKILQADRHFTHIEWNERGHLRSRSAPQGV